MLQQIKQYSKEDHFAPEDSIWATVHFHSLPVDFLVSPPFKAISGFQQHRNPQTLDSNFFWTIDIVKQVFSINLKIYKTFQNHKLLDIFSSKL